MSERRFQILALDGGGLRGIFSASFLAAIESHTGRRVTEHFDLIAGTSTGGIIALALGLGYRPSDILEFYLSEGKIVFGQSLPARLLALVRWPFFRKHPPAKLERALRRYFGNWLLGDSSVRLVIPAFDSLKGDVHVFKTAHHERLKADYRQPAWRVAMATSAAPTYLPAYTDETGARLIDGGVWANNPAMVALVEALSLLRMDQKHIALLSIGTTRSPIAAKPRHYAAGLFFGALKAFEFITYGQQIAATNQAQLMLGNERFLRINPLIQQTHGLDHLSKELQAIGESEARSKVQEVEKIFLGHKAERFEPFHIVPPEDGGTPD